MCTRVWGDRHQRAFFDVRVFNPLAQATVGLPLLPLTGTMRPRKEDAMNNEFRRLNMDYSLLLNSQPQGAWYLVQLSCTMDGEVQRGLLYRSIAG